MPLFRRKCSVTVGTLNVDNLRVQFDCSHTIKPEANKASVRIFNLNESSRKQLEMLPTLPVQIKCGYGDDPPSLIFLGDLRTVAHRLDGGDVVTEVRSGDKEEKLAESRINKAYPTGTPLATIIQDIAFTLAVNPGNLGQALAVARSKGTSNVVLPVGTVIAGPSARELTHMLDSIGYLWWIQDGALTVIDRKGFLAGTATLLTPETGLIGSPSVDAKGKMSCDCLILPDLRPGRLIVLKSKFLSGQYRISKVSFKGDTHGSDWIASIDGEKF